MNWESALRAVDRDSRSLQLSALQSRIFNRVLAARVGELDRLKPGDLAWIHASGACFAVGPEELEDPRLASLEISPSGPLPGRKATATRGEIAELEDAAIRAEGLEPFDFMVGADEKAGTRPRGARRPLRVPLQLHEWTRAGEDARLAFELPAGSFATTLLDELSKASLGQVS
jgi:tRNA pseudouridine13 synthase